MIEQLKVNGQKYAAYTATWLMGVIACITLLAFTCEVKDKDEGEQPSSKIMAEEHHRVKLGKCLDHHLTYAERMGGAGNRHADFAIARCANKSRHYTDDAYINLGSEDWHDPDREALRECKKQAWEYVGEHYPLVADYHSVRSFYIRSVCIPTKGTAY